jgi:AraC-like DNA-binding protein
LGGYKLAKSWRLDATIRRQWFIPKNWEGDGIISGDFENMPQLRDFLENHRLTPTVFVDQTSASWGTTVLQNCEHQAQLAFAHLRQQGYKRFHFIQIFNDPYSNARGEAFIKILHTEGLPVSRSITSHQKLHLHVLDNELLKALSKHAEPIGVFCANDYLASILAQVCQTHGYKIPQRLGLIGVDNDPIETELSVIPISSVDNNRYLHGLIAAQTLQQLMDHPRKVIPRQFIAPKGVLVRPSTQLSPTEPSIMRKARTLLADNYSNSKFRAQHLCDQLFISRRRLHSLFIAHFGMSAAELLLDYRIKCAVHLLKNDSLSIREVALLSGFAGPEYMSRVFIRCLKQRPSQLRPL